MAGDAVVLSEQDATEMLKSQAATINSLTKTIDQMKSRVAACDGEVKELRDRLTEAERADEELEVARQQLGDLLLKTAGSVPGAIALLVARCTAREKELAQLQQDDTPDEATMAEYLRYHGMFCPFCRSRAIVADVLAGRDVHAGAFFQTITCQKCHKRWTDRYELVAVEDAPT